MSTSGCCRVHPLKLKLNVFYKLLLCELRFKYIVSLQLLQWFSKIKVRITRECHNHRPNHGTVRMRHITLTATRQKEQTVNSEIFAVPWGCLRFVIVVFPDHTHLLFLSPPPLQWLRLLSVLRWWFCCC